MKDLRRKPSLKCPLSAIYWSDYRETIEKWGSDYTTSFDQDGLTIIFSAYELAAYVAGPQEFHFYLQCAGQLLERQRPYRA